MEKKIKSRIQEYTEKSSIYDNETYYLANMLGKVASDLKIVSQLPISDKLRQAIAVEMASFVRDNL
jgi:hypothetical protein